MKPFKHVVVTIVALLAFAGIYAALRNLPVASGCGFYGQCPSAEVDEDDAPIEKRVGATVETTR